MQWPRCRYFIIGAIAYIHGVSVILSTTDATPEARRTTSGCRQTEFDDIESRTVLSPIVVNGVVENLRRVRRTSSGVAVFRARLRVTDVLKGRLDRRDLDDRPNVTITVGTFARPSRRPAATASTPVPDVDEQCVSFGLPVPESRYIVFLRQPAASPADDRPVVYAISSQPEPFSAGKLQTVRRYSRRRYASSEESGAHRTSTSASSSRALLMAELRFKGVQKKTPARAAKVKVRPRDVTLLTDQRLRLRCRASGRPLPSVTWYKDGRRLEADRHFRIKSNRHGSRLQISQVTTDDSGTYECQGRNVAGPISSVVSRVQVRDPESTTKPHVRLCEDQTYCFNGGICYVLISIQRQLCECEAAFQGQRCQERRVVADIRPVVASASDDSDVSLLSFLMKLQRFGRSHSSRSSRIQSLVSSLY